MKKSNGIIKTDPKAIRRVKDAIPVPEVCRYCGEEVLLENNRHVYGHSVGTWPYVYACQHCRAYVGLHPKTKIPLGTLADGPLRIARRKAKALFHQYQHAHLMSRSNMYIFLALKMGKDIHTVHFGWFGKAECEEVIDIFNKLNQSWIPDVN